MTDRGLVWLALAFFGVSGVLTVDRLRRGDASPRSHRQNYTAMFIGFALQFAFLAMRGQAAGRCPLTNPFETTIFISWAAVLFYLVIGPSYRVSFLGAFTTPVVIVITLIALLTQSDVSKAAPATRSPWVDFHAAIAILAYGAFGLASVSGVMYLIQERQLKTRRLSSSFLLLPSIEQLDTISARLVLLGFTMLTVGMIGGFVSTRFVGPWTLPKTVWAVILWFIFAGLTAARQFLNVRGRKAVWATIVAFLIALVSYWAVNLCPVTK